MTSGALVTTANSSGESLVWPAASRMVSQPARAAATDPARTHCRSSRERMNSPNLAGLVPRARSRSCQCVVQKRDHPEGDGRIGDVEHIPVIAEGMKVEKIRHFPVNDPVDQIAQCAADDEAKADCKGAALRIP